MGNINERKENNAMLPNDVIKEAQELMKMGNPIPLSVGATRSLAKQYGLNALGDYLDVPENGGTYMTYVVKHLI